MSGAQGSGGRMRYERQAPTPGRICKDCAAESRDLGPLLAGKGRPAPFPGPRCATHWREEKRARRLRSAGRRVENTYGITPEEYDRLLAFQGGRCALCRRATGTSKRLAVDHDHRCCIGPTSCGRCVRGLVCGPCNDVLAHFRDSLEAGYRLAAYLERSPMQRMQLDEFWPPVAPQIIGGG